MISYKPLWHTLLDKNINKSRLQHLIGCSSRTITTMGKNEYVSLDVIDRICNILDCRIEDVIEFKREGEE